MRNFDRNDISGELSQRRRGLIALGTLFVSLAVCGLVGCLGDASHSNPLDPLSNGFEEVGIYNGRVTGIYSPFQGLSGASVWLTPGPFLAQTDSDGQFHFDRLPAQNYNVRAEKDGFSTVIDSVRVRVGRVVGDTLRLDGLPVVSNLELVTVHHSRWWPPPLDLFSLEVTATVSDPDGAPDVTQVWLEIPEMNFADTLIATTEPGLFVRNLTEADLPAPSLSSLLGRTLQIRLLDRAGIDNVIPARSLVRVIEQTPVATDPQGLVAVADATPKLTWDKMRLAYPFEYHVEVIRQEANVAIQVQTMAGISPDSTSVRVSAPLAPGTYSWAVSVVDEFGNRSRSKEAGFVVQ